ncbi:Solute-binding family 1 [Acididesulfobacillus acetoxydans]|uniref:Family 1 extracellular solute-binding protein n=1 Tax=Acididesulfobacillus acetoxydans TaxID=1561005 RepID=A0A8S0W7L6_9FIRM|nr:sugar ABC transporter substrate-binding protein [Acididesulfobacillus acetoxydans]CAA7600909.1 Solute-binding family 1 [Acididesulfobacillus acetoxydans]CEJ08934.1 Family 1 extracellular solute-binding protein [Acididesulfobacillus acetoxydans]
MFKRKLRRVFLPLMVSMLVVGMFAIGCGQTNTQAAGQSSQGKPVTINFMADSRPEFDKMEQLLPQFEKKTGIHVNYMKLQETPLRAKTGLEVSAPSTDIDVFMTDFMFLNKYAKAGYLAPLDKYLDASSTFNKANYMKPFIDSVSYKGQIYGMPLYQDCNILVYRADIFKKLHLTVPKTFAELEHDAKVIKENEPGMAGIVMRGQRGYGVNEWTWPTFLEGFGGSYLTQDEKAGNLTSPEAIQALTYYTDILKKYGPPGVANYSYVEVQNDMMQGKVGMFVDSATLAPRCEDPSASKVAGKLGFAMVPGDKAVAPGFYSWTLAVPAHAKHKAAAAKFIAWLTSPKIATECGFSAPNQALEKVYNIPAYPGTEPLIDVMKASLKLANPDYRPRIPQADQVGTAVSVAISSVLDGSKTPKEALTQANDEVNRILQGK